MSANAPLHLPLEDLRGLVQGGHTRPLTWRFTQIGRLERLIDQHERVILEALAADLGKPPLEAYFELAAVRFELKLTRRRLRRWMAPRPVSVPLSQQPARAFVVAEPLGCVLIIGPWNFPFQLCLQPLVSILAAGNTAVLKPSEHAPHTGSLLAQLLEDAFPADTVAVVLGDGDVAQDLLQERFDHIFFTGGARVARLVMAAAARHLTPLTLELGGKSPAIVLADADLEVSARRLIWGKGLNAGQACVAPDHLLVEAKVREPFLAHLKAEIARQYGDDPLQSPDLPQIVNTDQFERLRVLLERARQRGQVLAGGHLDPAGRRMAPTLLAVRNGEDPLMQEELFGPLLPIQTVGSLDDAIEEVNGRPKPLALYLFSRNPQAQERLLARTSSGGVVFNDVVVQAAVPQLPFGGVGESGMGSYHGQAGFEAFSHRRSVLRRPFWLDLPLRYAPYGERLGLVRRLLG
ncbi:aldehyde dehydrogenase family protein [Cyanobium sp. Morenito 9A2]|uniref:aldehyde dehydrogenase family protein n=1 Tax=Cyanobium sp. Morenito 9A2 TaxID=2823718 RepID=UPI0020CE265A|nr:aldehyde dehydrogenase family protein [Cyanobium sp. Morenito 9A2]MCP9851106.1 aldehyde dehydrogenase family protein [Cyanobium sp. Morenito 9A2]